MGFPHTCTRGNVTVTIDGPRAEAIVTIGGSGSAPAGLIRRAIRDAESEAGLVAEHGQADAHQKRAEQTGAGQEDEAEGEKA